MFTAAEKVGPLFCIRHNKDAALQFKHLYGKREYMFAPEKQSFSESEGAWMKSLSWLSSLSHHRVKHHFALLT